MATRLGRLVTYDEGLQLTKSHELLVMSFARLRDKQKSLCNSTTIVGMVTKFGTVVTWLKGLQTIK